MIRGMSFRPEVVVPAEARRGWEREPTLSQHNLSECPLFTEEALALLLDRTPRENLFALHMGHDPERSSENRLAVHDGVSGADLLRAVKNGRLWLNVTRIDLFADQYREVVDDLYGQLRRQLPGFEPRVTTITLLVSSPGALVYYHVDGPASLLWHVRGEKRIWIYPIEERLVDPRDLEAIFAGAAHEYLPYRLDFDASAQRLDLVPGMLAGWPPNSPHRVTNGPTVNVSLSTEHFTPRHRRKARIYRANHFLRTKLGLTGLQTELTGPKALAKQVLIGVASRAGLDRSTSKRHVPVLRVEPNSPGGVGPL